MLLLGDVVGPGFFVPHLNAENLMRRPFGCGEQNMFNFAVNLYNLKFLKVSMHAYTRTRARAHTHTSSHTLTHTHAHLHIPTHARSACTHTHTPARTQKHTHAHTRTHTHTHTHTQSKYLSIAKPAKHISFFT